MALTTQSFPIGWIECCSRVEQAGLRLLCMGIRTRYKPFYRQSRAEGFAKSEIAVSRHGIFLITENCFEFDSNEVSAPR